MANIPELLRNLRGEIKMKYTKHKTIRNFRGEKSYSCYFTYNGTNYYASLCYTPDHGNECMIFPESSWEEVYQKNGIAISEDNLIACIEEFVN